MNEKTAQNIKHIRELKNFTQEYVANQLGISVRGYSKIENGETHLTLRRLEEIAIILGTSPIEIMQFDPVSAISTSSTTNDSNNSDLLLQTLEYLKEQNKKLLELIAR